LSLEDLADLDLALAVVAAEDQKFPQHEGFDFKSIKQTLDDRAQGKPPGAVTA